MRVRAPRHRCGLAPLRDRELGCLALSLGLLELGLGHALRLRARHLDALARVLLILLAAGHEGLDEAQLDAVAADGVPRVRVRARVRVRVRARLGLGVGVGIGLGLGLGLGLG